MDKCSVYSHMGKETILYYVTTKFLETANPSKAEKCKRKTKRLPEFWVIEQENLDICVVPLPISEEGRNNRWTRSKANRKYKKLQRRIPEPFLNAEVVMQPEILLQSATLSQSAMLLQSKILQQSEIPAIYWKLAQYILEEIAAEYSRKKVYYEKAVLLLNSHLFIEEQMRCFMKQMQSLFPYINQLDILLTVPEEVKEKWQETITEYTDTIYYEYGITAQIACKETESICRKTKIVPKSGNTLFLDYGYEGELPWKEMRHKGSYLDMTASAKKEKLIKRKYPALLYLSARKYLDTMVKSGYDKLVNLCK